MQNCNRVVGWEGAEELQADPDVEESIPDLHSGLAELVNVRFIDQAASLSVVVDLMLSKVLPGGGIGSCILASPEEEQGIVPTEGGADVGTGLFCADPYCSADPLHVVDVHSGDVGIPGGNFHFVGRDRIECGLMSTSHYIDGHERHGKQ